MKRFIFTALLGSIVTLSFGQSTTNLVPMKMKSPICVGDGYTTTGAPASTNSNTHTNNGPSASTGGSRAVTTTTIGSAGNLLTILDGSINRIAANNTLNSVVFIHRADPTVFPALNVGQYLYDVSADGGATWNINNGPLNPTGNNQTTAGRYPNVVIYNPQGNTNPANAYLGYLGSWLPFAASAADWDGLFTGVARLNNNASTFTETISTPNNSDISIARGMTNGIPGVFWATDWSFDGTQNSDILLYRGVWNSFTNDIDWSIYTTFTPNHEAALLNDAAPTGLNMAFDPSGRYGYVVYTGDLVGGNTGFLEPVVYSTNDGGVTWTGPEQISLGSIDIIQDNLVDTTGNPTTAFDLDVVVDATGKPHIAVVIGTSGGTDYSIGTGTAAGLALYDVTIGNDNCDWTAYRLSSIATFRGTWAGDITEDNRPQASISADGNKVIFSWLDSDPAAAAGENSQPNFHTRGLDIVSGLATVVTNWTAGDVTWDGSALFASLAPTSFQSGNTVKVPTVFATLDPFTLDPENPATFHYVQDIQYTNAEFTEDITAPEIALNGSNPLTIVQNGTYNEPGATVSDNVGAGAVVISGTVNTAVVGSYFVTYTVSDNAGNEACTVIRRVNVVAAPDNTAPVIVVQGANPLTVDVCGYYNEPGATATDNVDGNITGNITNDANLVPFGTLGTQGTPGQYTITYTVTDGAGNTGTATRTVNIVDLGPTITVAGGLAQTIEVCDSFVTPSATAFDNCDGFITISAPTGAVNNKVAGTYNIVYTATDGNNNTTTSTLVVTVSPDQTPPVITISGASTVYVYLGDAYNDVLPTADDCSGILSLTSNAGTSVNVSTAGTYTVTYTATDSNSLVSTAQRTVIVGTEPDPRFTWAPVTGFPGRIRFQDASLYNPTSWLWEFGDPLGTTNNQTATPTFTYPDQGEYEVCLTARNLFNSPPFSKPAAKYCETINVAIGINDVSILERSISVYPNPTSGNLTINVKDLTFETMNVKVFNMIGERVLAGEYTKVQAQSNINLNISGNASGMYMIQISTEQGVITKRINLQNGL